MVKFSPGLCPVHVWATPSLGVFLVLWSCFSSIERPSSPKLPSPGEAQAHCNMPTLWAVDVARAFFFARSGVAARIER